MNIILEGNECTFKTTLADYLAERTKMPIMKGSSFNSALCTQDELFRFYKETFNRQGVIFDRSFYSNLVYGPLYPKYTTISQEQLAELEELVADSVVIWHRASTDVIKERLRIRGDEYIKEEDIDIINERYEGVMRKARLVVIQFDTERRTVESFYDGIAKHLVRWGN